MHPKDTTPDLPNPPAPALSDGIAGDDDGIRALVQYLVTQTHHCLRPPIDRFRHSWIAPMPLSQAAELYLERRRSGSGPAPGTVQSPLAQKGTGDGFAYGDYSLGLFHHDASEAAIELVHHDAFREAMFGSLLCFLDCASPSGCIHRVELCHKAREAEPSKPVMAQLALRVIRASGADGLARADQYRVLPRLLRFLAWTEEHYTGLHGLLLTHSSLASGFDSDILTAALPDRCVEGPDTNAFMVLEYQAAAALARMLGQDAEAGVLEEKAAHLSELIERLLWYEDDRGGMYLALRWQHGVGSLEGEIVGARDPHGVFRPLESWTTLLPLYAGIPSPERATRLVRRLVDPAGYWGPAGVRTAPACDPFFHQACRVMLYDFKKHGRGPVSNWSGPVWVLSNYYMASGLARYGYRAEARTLAARTLRLLAGGLERDGVLHECYNDQGQGLWPRAGTFISWNVLAMSLLREHFPESVAKLTKVS